mmetsp:Transcript_26149/g.89454  ORF Transcript_26149/g.89454 Transcript_26149/m.89454 type:complete len:128 (-) Transcript_26149:308-691(-)
MVNRLQRAVAGGAAGGVLLGVCVLRSMRAQRRPARRPYEGKEVKGAAPEFYEGETDMQKVWEMLARSKTKSGEACCELKDFLAACEEGMLPFCQDPEDEESAKEMFREAAGDGPMRYDEFYETWLGY